MMPGMERRRRPNASLELTRCVLSPSPCHLGDLYTESGQTSQCSFSSVSTPPIARVGAFFSILRDLQDFHAFAPLRAQNFGKKLPYFLPISTEKSQKFAKIRSKFGKFSRNFAGISRKFRSAKGSRSSRVLPGFFRTFFSFFQADALHCAAF